MMELTQIRTLFRESVRFADKEITVGGWIRNRRDSKTFGFINLNEGSFFE